MNAMRNALLLFILFRSVHLSAGDSIPDYYSNGIQFNDRVYVKNIATVQLSPDPDQLIPPIIKLGTDDRLYLSFDDLDADRKDYYYAFVHCTSDWKETNIMQSEFLE